MFYWYMVNNKCDSNWWPIEEISHDAASSNDIMSCIKIDKAQVVYMFRNII